MESYEFIALVTDEGQLEIPEDVVEKLPRGQTVKVSLSIPENGLSNGQLSQAQESLPGVPLGELLKYAGAISDEDAQLMIQAIEAECERIDLSEWQ